MCRLQGAGCSLLGAAFRVQDTPRVLSLSIEMADRGSGRPDVVVRTISLEMGRFGPAWFGPVWAVGSVGSEGAVATTVMLRGQRGTQ